MSDYLNKLCETYNRIKINDYIPQEKKPIFHYTSPAGLIGILTNISLRFSDRDFLNDYSEGKYVVDLCIKYSDEILPYNEDFKCIFINSCKNWNEHPQLQGIYTYQCSFSTNSDSLSLWNYYTKGDSIKGYNLKFIPDELIQNLSPTNKCDRPVPHPFFGKVVYSEKKQKDIIKAVIKQFYDATPIEYYQFSCSNIISKLVLIGAFFKPKWFKTEEEYRIVYTLRKGSGTFVSINEKEFFSERNGAFVPYVDIPFNAESLKGIKLSPTLEFEATKQGLYRMLEKDYYNIPSDNICMSSIPVRY